MRKKDISHITKYLCLVVIISLIASCSTYKGDFRSSLEYYSSLHKNKESLKYLYNARVWTSNLETLDEYAHVYYLNGALDSIIGNTGSNKERIKLFYIFSGYENLDSYRINLDLSSGISNIEDTLYNNEELLNRLNYIGYKIINASVCVGGKPVKIFRGYDDYIIFQYQPGLEIHYYENVPPASIDTTKVNYIKIKDHWYYYSKHLESEKQKKRLKEILKDSEKRTSRW